VSAPALETVLARAFQDPRAPEPGRRLLVAVSGGRDSLALLHLLRFGTPGGGARRELVAAHLDHALRRGSASDAAWLSGLCQAWGVPLIRHRLEAPPQGEAEARAARYAFLEEARAEAGAVRTLTAHHAGDQSETVLFRAARGTGLSGLRGIRTHRDPALWRPFLKATPDEIDDYARAVGLRWRQDPSNQDRSFTRNALRHEVLPRLERAVPGAARHLSELAHRARDAEEAWAAVLPRLLEESERAPRGGGLQEGIEVSRTVVAGYPAALRARLLRRLAQELGVTLTSTQTARAVTFAEEGASGHAVPLRGGVELARELDRLVLRASDRSPPPDRPVAIAAPESGSAEARLGGARWRVAWGPAPTGLTHEAAFDTASLAFPLELRGRKPGDALPRSVGHTSLKKLLLEARIPSDRRSRVPVLADALDRVLWVADVARSDGAEPGSPSPTFHIGCTHADTD